MLGMKKPPAVKQGVLGLLALVQCAWATVTCVLLLAHKHVFGCDLDQGMCAGGSVHECAVKA